MPRKKTVYKASSAVRMDHDATFNVFTFPAFRKSISNRQEVQKYIRRELGMILSDDNLSEIFRICREEGTVMVQGKLRE